jgi:hypothetical protein
MVKRQNIQAIDKASFTTRPDRQLIDYAKAFLLVSTVVTFLFVL